LIGMIAGTLAIVAVTIMFGVWASRKKGIVPTNQELVAARPKAPRYAAGEATSTAIRAGAEQLERLRATQRCKNCRAMMTVAGEDTVRYDDGDMLVLDLHCTCGARRGLYVRASTPTTA
jgi:RNase P subunit RPR2